MIIFTSNNIGEATMTNQPHRLYERIPEQSRISIFEMFEQSIKLQEERIEWLRDREKEHPKESKVRKQSEKILNRAFLSELGS